MIEKLRENMHRIQQGGSFVMFIVFFVVVVFFAYMAGKWSMPTEVVSGENMKRQKIIEEYEGGKQTKSDRETWYWEPKLSKPKK